MDLIKGKQIMAIDYKKRVYERFICRFARHFLRHDRRSFTLRDYIQPSLAKDKTFGDLSFRDNQTVSQAYNRSSNKIRQVSHAEMNALSAQCSRRRRSQPVL